MSQRCLHHSKGPDRDHPRHGRAGAGPRVVVGIDGSETSRRALRWAIEEARLLHGSLEVIHSWHLPYVGGYPYAASTYDATPFEEAARRTLDGVVEDTDTTGLEAPPERILHLGDPAAALLDAARGAALVVAGSRGLGGFSGLLLGSVGHHVAHHAPCPVVVVPPAS